MGDRPVLRGLTGLRGVAAIWVVVNHFEDALLSLFPGLAWLRPVTGHGWLGVEIFFVLSGFVIAHNYVDRLAAPTPASLRSYYWARLARVYPVHLVTLLALSVLVLGAGAVGVTVNSTASYTLTDFTGNLILAQAVPPFHALNVPAWSVSCEVAAYVGFPLLALGLARLSGRSALGVAASVLVVGVVGLQLLGLAVGTFLDLPFPVMWVRIVVEFTAGALLWRWWREAQPAGRRWDGVVLGCLGATLVVLVLTGRNSPATYLAMPLLAVLVVATASATGPVDAILSSRSFQFGGRISYSLYMIHFPVFLVATKLIGWDRFAGAALPVRVLAAGVILVLIVGTACAVYYLVEEPGRRYLRRRAERSSRRTGSVGLQVDPDATAPVSSGVLRCQEPGGDSM